MNDSAQKRREKAMGLFHMGYNCAQAVIAAYDDVIDIDQKTAIMLGASFGGGMGRLREVCGAVSGAFAVLGLVKGYHDPADNVAKKAHYELIQSFAAEFKEKNSSYICRELLNLPEKKTDAPTPEPRTQEYYKKRPCAELVGDAAEILFKYIF